MSKRVFAVAVLCLLVLLVACESKTTGKRVAIPETTSKPSVTGVVTASGEKSGSFYPPVITDATGTDALKAKTRALMTQGTYDPNSNSIGEFGAKYHEK